MGLDMYARTAPASAVGDAQVDFEMPANAPEIAYWRKFNALHGWMEQLYREKGGAKEFNCTPVRLTEGDIAQLQVALACTYAQTPGALKPVQGFFFGAQEVYPEHLEDLQGFLAQARIAFAHDQAVFYYAWY